MPFDVGNKTDRDRLHKAKKTSRDAWASFCNGRTEMIRSFTGSWYSVKGGSRRRTYVNRLQQSARIATMALAFNNPQVKIASFNPDLWPFARKYETTVNRVIANIDFKTTFQAGLLDAFFLMGIFKVYLADAGETMLDDDVWIDPGKPWVDRISPDDAILDLSVKDIRAMRFMGDRRRVNFASVQARDDFDRKVVAAMSATSKTSIESGTARASEIATGCTVDDDELEPMCWLEDIYLPETRQLVTFSADNDSLPPLKVMEDDNGPGGPYEFLGLGPVPDNIIHVSPASNLKALHDLGNRTYGKLADQVDAQKNIVGFEKGGTDVTAKSIAAVSHAVERELRARSMGEEGHE